MQKFIEADYYELDWYYEECTDGKSFFFSPHFLMQNLKLVRPEHCHQMF